MSPVFWLVVAAVIVVGTAVAWWTSGRSRPGGRLAGQTRDANETRAMSQHRPTDGGWNGGASL